MSLFRKSGLKTDDGVGRVSSQYGTPRVMPSAILSASFSPIMILFLVVVCCCAPSSFVSIVPVGIPRLGEVSVDDLPADVYEHFVHVLPPSCTGLVVWDIAPSLRHLESLCSRYRAVFFKIAFVAHEDNGHVWIVFEVH